MAERTFVDGGADTYDYAGRCVIAAGTTDALLGVSGSAGSCTRNFALLVVRKWLIMILGGTIPQ